MSNLTPEDSERVKEIKAALEAEFDASDAGSIKKSTLKEVEDLKPDALLALQHTIKHSPNESLKAKVSMWAVDKLLDAQKIEDEPMKVFLKELSETKTRSS